MSSIGPSLEGLRVTVSSKDDEGSAQMNHQESLRRRSPIGSLVRMDVSYRGTGALVMEAMWVSDLGRARDELDRYKWTEYTGEEPHT